MHTRNTSNTSILSVRIMAVSESKILANMTIYARILFSGVARPPLLLNFIESVKIGETYKNFNTKFQKGISFHTCNMSTSKTLAFCL